MPAASACRGCAGDDPRAQGADGAAASATSPSPVEGRRLRHRQQEPRDRRPGVLQFARPSPTVVRGTRVGDGTRSLGAVVIDEWNCPGEGKCHGCLCWCDLCGDVGEVCDASGCMRHRCTQCDGVLTADQKEFGVDFGLEGMCFDCLVAETMRKALLFDHDEVRAGERRRSEIDRWLADRTPRCLKCQWPLAAKAAEGCTAASCSMRPKL